MCRRGRQIGTRGAEDEVSAHTRLFKAGYEDLVERVEARILGWCDSENARTYRDVDDELFMHNVFTLINWKLETTFQRLFV